MSDDLRGVSDEELREQFIPAQFRKPKRSKSYRPSPPLRVPGIVEHFTERAHRFKCPQCFSVFVGVYKPEKPLPVCMGRAGALHPRWMLVSEVHDEYEHMRARLERGDPTGRPIINPRTAAGFEVQRPPDNIRDLGTPGSSPRG